MLNEPLYIIIWSTEVQKKKEAEKESKRSLEAFKDLDTSLDAR